MQNLVVLLSGLALTGCGTFADPTEWFGDSTAVEPSPLVELSNQIQPRTLWTRDIGGGTDERQLTLVPRAVGSTLYVADADGEVQALDTNNGVSRWRADLDLPLSGGPGVGDGIVVLGTNDAEVIALNAEDGSERWRTRVSSEILSVPAVGNGVVVVYSIDGKLVGLEATTGARRWGYEREVPTLTLRGSGSPVLAGGVAYVGMAGGKLLALRGDNGDLLWETDIKVPSGRSELERLADIDGDPIVMRGGVFVSTYQGNVAAVEQRSGKMAWRRKMSSYNGMAADDNGLYVADADGVVWGLELRTGNVRWSQEALRDRRLSKVAVLGDYVVVGDFEGYLHWMAREDGNFVARTRVGSDPITTGVQTSNGVLYVQGDGGDVAAIGTPAGQ